MTTKEKVQEAITCFGRQVVNEVVFIVQMSDPDGAYTLFEDERMFDHSGCVEMLYFE